MYSRFIDLSLGKKKRVLLHKCLTSTLLMMSDKKMPSLLSSLSSRIFWSATLVPFIASHKY